MEGNLPNDYKANRRVFGIINTIKRYFPKVGAAIFEKVLEARMRKKNPNMDPSWRLLPAPPFDNSTGVMNEYIITKLETGEVTSLHGIKQFTENGIITDNGEDFKVDSVIFATGYHFDYSVLSQEADPTAYDMPEWRQAAHTSGLRFPRLYMTYFSTKFPLSLAFIGPCKGHTFAAFTNSEIATQAIAQVWKGSYSLPSQQEMDRWCDENYRTSLKIVQQGRAPKTGTYPDKLEEWLIDAAGNELNEMISWSWKAWKFWWKERDLYRLIMSGVNTPYAYRLFNGRPGARPKWEGAADAIYAANGKIPPSRLI